MNTSPSNEPRRSPWKRVLLWIGALTAGSLVVLASAAVYTLTLDRDARALRRSIVDSLGSKIESTIEVHAGEALIAAARVGTHWCHEIPEPVRVALASLRSASVGVYRIDKPSSSHRAELLVRAQAAMQSRGWTRVVGVNDNQTTVLVYTPEAVSSAGTQRVCVAVIDGDQLIVASARGDVFKLAELGPVQQVMHRL